MSLHSLYPVFIEEACKAIVDLAFVIDSSGSISGRNWRLLKAFIKEAIDAFDVSPKGTHIASVSYSTRPVVDYRFNTLIGDKLNAPGLHKFVDKIRHQRGFTYIDRALALANKEIFSDKGGMRQAVKKVSPSNNQSLTQTLLGLATVPPHQSWRGVRDKPKEPLHRSLHLTDWMKC